MLYTIVKAINHLLWNQFLIFFLTGTGIFFTIKLGFVQIRYFWSGLINTFTGRAMVKEGKTKGMTPFQALSTAVAAQIGTGNLAGAATAIVSGGPGAIFWIWFSSFFGMASIFAETVMGQKYRQKIEGEYVGGPAYYIRHGLKKPWLAAITATMLIITMGFIGPMVQSNSIAIAFNTSFHIPLLIGGGIISLLIGLIIFGGMSRIAHVAETVVPFMAVAYFLGGTVILWLFKANLIPAIKLIFIGAFNPKAVLGGAAGITVRHAMRYGISRGLFSNEAGLGSTPHAHAVAQVKHPADQGFIAMIGVFIDTFIVLTMTAMVILATGSYTNGLTGVELTQSAFQLGFGSFGNLFVSISLFFFAFTTIMSCAFFAEENVKYLLVPRFGHKAVTYFRIGNLIFILFGAFLKVATIWELADLFYGLIAIPNLIAILLLSSTIKKELKTYTHPKN